MLINDFINKNNQFSNKYISIDTDKIIFANMSNTHSIYYILGLSISNYVINKEKHKIINIDNNKSPSIISGCSNFNMTKYILFLGYNKDLIIKRNYKLFMIHNIINYLKTYFYIKK